MHLYSAAHLIAGLAAAAMAAAYDCPLPLCDACVPDGVRKAPGVGIELTASYGAVAVQHFDRSIDDIARVNGSDDYHRLLRRVSLSTSHPNPSFLDRWHRKINKCLGRPATADVGTLSAMLTALRSAAEQHLQAPLDRVVVTNPQLPGLEPEDLQDAIDHAGLRSWLLEPFPSPNQLPAPNAAYAANGRGLCTEWKNVYACWEEAELGELPLETVLGVSFTDTMLHTSLTRIGYAFGITADIHTAAPELGYRSLPEYPRPEAYWDAVAAHLKHFVAEMHEWGHQITEVVLLGDRAGDERFAQALRDALDSGAAARVSHLVDPTWAASRGAAMYARIRQEVPSTCAEPRECETRRASGLVTNEL